MAIGNCDCCDRRDVPGSVVDCAGEPFACFICQSDTDPDPYGELDEREEPCGACGGDGGHDVWIGWQRCSACDGSGHFIAQIEPITPSDLDRLDFEIRF